MGIQAKQAFSKRRLRRAITMVVVRLKMRWLAIPSIPTIIFWGTVDNLRG